MEGSQGICVGVGVNGKGEGVKAGGRGVEVGEGMRIVGVVVGMGSGVGAGAQEASSNKSKSRDNFFIKRILWSPTACWRFVRRLLLFKCYTPTPWMKLRKGTSLTHHTISFPMRCTWLQGLFYTINTF